MPPRIFNREQSRRVDQLAIKRYGISGLVLMENAGRGAVDVLEQIGITSPIAICCGRGNNGGDGFVMARYLHARGYTVKLLLFADPSSLTGDAAVNFAIAQKIGLPLVVFDKPFTDDELDAELANAGCIVDALLGTGSRGEPRPPLDRVIDAINRQRNPTADAIYRERAPVVAVDLPSGLDCDSGAAASHTIRAAHTVTFVAAKPGLLAPEAAPYVGRLHVVNLGLPPELLDEIARG
jgi:NAD(P)H-hydrate epimerase